MQKAIFLWYKYNLCVSLLFFFLPFILIGNARGGPTRNVISWERQALTNILVLSVRESSKWVLFVKWKKKIPLQSHRSSAPVQFLSFGNALPYSRIAKELSKIQPRQCRARFPRRGRANYIWLHKNGWSRTESSCSTGLKMLWPHLLSEILSLGGSIILAKMPYKHTLQ